MALIDPDPIPAQVSSTPMVDRWITSMGLSESSRALADHGADFLGEIAGAAMTSVPATKLLRSVRFKLEQGEKGGGAVRLDGDDAQNKTAVSMARRLVNVGFLTSAKEQDGRLNFAMNNLGDGQRRRLTNFLKGSWLEHGARQVARSELGGDTELVMNLSLVDQSNAALELDLVVGLPGGGIAVVECKAGKNIARFLPRFRDVCDTVGVDGPCAILVASGVGPEVVADAQAFHRITVVAPELLGSHLRTLVPATAPTLVVVPEPTTEDLPTAENPGVGNGSDE